MGCPERAAPRSWSEGARRASIGPSFGLRGLRRDNSWGEYGAGKVEIWDRGEHILKERTARKISFILNGAKLSGEYELVLMKVEK